MPVIDVPSSALPRVVIIGAGFGGLRLARKLRKKPFQVVLIDRSNFHTFQPLLYQVATAGIEADSIAYPVRKVFSGLKNFHFRMDTVLKIVPEKKVIICDNGDLTYDYLVIATGSDTNFFGNEEIMKNSMPMKTVAEALNLRSYILQNLEKAVQTTDENEKRSLMNYVIVGGGPTGVELAGALGELKRHVLPCDYPDLDFRRMHITLVESAPRVLAAFHEKNSTEAKHFLEELGVTVWLETLVKSYDGKIIKTSTGKEIVSSTVIWTAGVMGKSIIGVDSTLITKGGRTLVNQFCQVKGYPEIFAVGDVAQMVSEDNPRGHPMVAQVAIQMGELVAENIERLKNKKPLKNFEYKDKGSMATIGRNKAVVEIGKYKSQGIFAWLMWMFVHLMALVGFRNKLIVFINWIWYYFNYDRGIRLIIRPFTRK